MPERAKRDNNQLIAAALTFVIVASIATPLILGRPLLFDSDGYYHTAVARLYAEEGVDANLGLRASTLGESLGDKELLFHLAMVPAIWLGMDSLQAGKAVLVVVLALDAAILAWLAFPVIGRWAIVLPIWLPFAATHSALRLVRVRPETLALGLFLLAIWAIGRSRFRWLALIAFTFTLSYTAFHALLGLCGLVFLQRGVVRHRWQPAMVVYPTLGASLAHLIHPHSPHNLVVWVQQTFEYFRLKTALDIGTEILPLTTDVLLRANVVLALSLVVLWLARATPPDRVEEDATPDLEEPTDRDLVDALAVGAIVFGLLFLLMARFSIYFVPFLVLWFLWWLESRGERPGKTTRIGRLRVPTAIALVVVAVVGARDASVQLRNYLARTQAGPNDVVMAGRVALGASIPSGARVAATWQDTPVYLQWAPQGRYLNVLDPVFQAIPHPQIHVTQARLFAGQAADPVVDSVFGLDSQFIAHSTGPTTNSLAAQLEADPRVQPLHRQFHVLWHLQPDRNRDFVLDWRVVAAHDSSGRPSAVDGGRMVAPSQEHRPWATYVDLLGDLTGAGVTDRSRPGCITVRHRNADSFQGVLSLAPWGPTRLTLDGQLLLSVDASLGARLDRALSSGVELEPDQELEVLTCSSTHPESGAPGRGFSLRKIEISGS